MTLGKIRTGSLVSSAMLTESSKPTMAKKASAVAAVTATNSALPCGVSNSRQPREVAVAAAERPQRR